LNSPDPNSGSLTLPGAGRPRGPAGPGPKHRETQRERSAAAAERELRKSHGTSRPKIEPPFGFRFELAEEPGPPLDAAHLLRRCVLVRPYIREIFALGIAARGGSQRGERSFQIPGSKHRAIEAVLDLIPPEITYSRDAWAAQNKSFSARHAKLRKELDKLSCREDPSFKVADHPTKGLLSRMAVVLTASGTQGLFCKVLTRAGGWLEEDSPLHAWHENAIRPPEPVTPDQAVDLAHQILEDGFEVDDPSSILNGLEDLVRGHLAVRTVPGLPGLADVVRGRAEGWPASELREVVAEEARREVLRSKQQGMPAALDDEVADVLRMAAARPALDGDLLPPQRIAVARQRTTQRGMTNASQVGTGKSPVTLIACRGKAAELAEYRLCLVVPRAIRSEWIEEHIPSFWEGVAVKALDGARVANELIMFDRELGSRPGIAIATFEQVRSSVEALRVLTYDDLVVDEADCLANPNTQLSRALWRLRGRAKVAIPLTATPLGKSLEELDAIEAFARNDREALRRKPLARRYGSLDDMTLRRLRRALGPTLIRITREEMSEYMPDVGEAEHKIIDPSPAERILIAAAEDRVADLFGQLRQQVERALALSPDDAELAELRHRMASTRGLLLSATEIALLASSDAEALRASTAIAAGVLESEGLVEEVVRTKPTKRTWIAGTLAAAEADGEQTLVVAESVEILRLLSRELADGHDIEAPLYIGGLGEREALTMRRAFRRGDFGTLLVSPVGAKGLNLPASLVVHYDLPWTSRKFEQRTGRATRAKSKYDAVAVLLALMRNTPEIHRAEVLIPRAVRADGTLNRGEDGTARVGEGGSKELTLQLAGLASELASKEDASTKMRVAARIFESRKAAMAAA
jgi:helicase-like protein/SNF2 domain-containing protein